jgi:hypothetical protein
VVDGGTNIPGSEVNPIQSIQSGKKNEKKRKRRRKNREPVSDLWGSENVKNIKI